MNSFITSLTAIIPSIIKLVFMILVIYYLARIANNKKNNIIKI